MNAGENTYISSYVHNDCCVPFRLSNKSTTVKQAKRTIRFPSLDERKKDWLFKIRRDEEPQFKVWKGVTCGKDTLAFDLVTR